MRTQVFKVWLITDEDEPAITNSDLELIFGSEKIDPLEIQSFIVNEQVG